MNDVTVGEELEARMVIHFAEQLGISSQHLAAILDGYDSITLELAGKLARMFPETTCEYWIGLSQKKSSLNGHH